MSTARKRTIILVGISLLIGVALVLCLFPQARGVLNDVSTGLRSGGELNQAALHPQYDKTERATHALGIPTTLKDIFSAPGPLNQNAFALYLKVADDKRYPTSPDELTAIKLISATSPKTASGWAAASRFLSQQKELVAFADAAARRPFCNPPLPNENADPLGLKFPEYAGVRRATRIITIRSLVLAHGGRFKEAVAEQSLGFRAAEHAKKDRGLLISSLVGIACEAITLSGIENILREAHGNPLVANMLNRSIATDCQITNPAVAVARETALGNAEIRYIQKHGPAALTSTLDTPSDPLPTVVTSRWEPFIDLDGTFYLELMQQSVSAAQLPYPQSKNQLAAIEGRISTREPVKGLLAAILYPVASNYCTKCVQMSSKAAITRTACAIFLYKSKHGAYPSTIADATSTAIDPFDGKLLGYRRTASGFVVYSVGPTGKYDGGDFDSKKGHEEVFRYQDNG